MDTSHIKNTLNVLINKQESFNKNKLGDYEVNEMTANQWIEIFKDELLFRK